MLTKKKPFWNKVVEKWRQTTIYIIISEHIDNMIIGKGTQVSVNGLSMGISTKICCRERFFIALRIKLLSDSVMMINKRFLRCANRPKILLGFKFV